VSAPPTPVRVPTIPNREGVVIAAPSRSRLAAVAVMTVAVAISACGSAATSSPTTASTAGTASVASTTQTRAVASKEVIAAYRTMWADLVTAAVTSDFQSPLLAQHATGDALTLLVQGLARDQLHGIVTRGVTVHHPAVTSLSPTSDPTHAMVADCFDDTHWIEYTTDGTRAKNTPGGHRATTADLVKKGGTWKVSQLVIQATGTC
jgi:hypothetical protein